jgi:hypothetical protein
MENQLMSNVDIKDRVIDRLHYLVEIGDYFGACAIYEEFQQVLSELSIKDHLN